MDGADRTAYGGANGAGFLYRVSADGNFKAVHDFQKRPTASFDTLIVPLLFDAQDTLFGVSRSAIVKKTPGDDLELRADLPKTASSGRVIARAPDGTLFVSAFFGDCAGKDSMGRGALVELRLGQPAAKCLHGADPLQRGNFDTLVAVDGDTVFGTLDGDLGANRTGAIFQWTRADGMKILHVFDQEKEGTRGKIVRGPDGNFYGTTIKIWSVNGTYTAGHGVLFKMTPAGAFTVLHKFSCGADGCAPWGVVPQDGYLYGTAGVGGAHGAGVLFRYRLAHP